MGSETLLPERGGGAEVVGLAARNDDDDDLAGGEGGDCAGAGKGEAAPTPLIPTADARTGGGEWIGLAGIEEMRCLPPFLRGFLPKSPKSAWRSDAPSRLDTMLPLKQKLMVPRSSLTTTTTASVSSVMPSAAR